MTATKVQTKRATPFGVALFALSTKEVYDMSNDRITENEAANFKPCLRAAYAQRKDQPYLSAARPSSTVSYASKKSKKPVMNIVS